MRAVRILLALIAIGVLALTLTPWIDRISPTWLPPIQALIRVWALVAVVGMIVSLLSRAWWPMTAFLVAALASALVIVNINVENCRPSDRAVSLLVLNTEYASAPAAEIAEVVSDRNVDVLILAEVHSAYVDELLSMDELAHLAYRSGTTPEEPSTEGTVILSRFEGVPFEVEGEASTFGQPGFRLNVDGKTVTVRAVHPKPPIEKWLGDWQLGLKELGVWQRTIKGEPIIMAGDFNASRAHPAFRDASHRMDTAAGRVAKATWPVNGRVPAFTDIDHVLTREMVAVDHETLTFSQTDHRGIWTNLAVCE